MIEMTTTSNLSSTEEQVFLGTLQECLQTDTDKRTAAEAIYQDIPDETKAFLLMSTLRNTTISGPIRSFAAVLLRRLFQTQFEKFWPKYSPDQQMALKKELLARITQLDDDNDRTIRKKICLIAAQLARNLTNEHDQSQWPEIMEFLVQSANSSHHMLKVSALIIFEAFPGIFANQAEQLTQIIHQIFLNCLNDQDTQVRYTAATALAVYLQHSADNTQLLHVYRDSLPCFLSTVTHSLANSDDDTVLKALIDVAENVPKYLRPGIDEICNLCLQTMQQKDQFKESRHYLALEVLVTLSETSSAMVRKVAQKYMTRLVSQLLEMMVDLDNDSDWSTKDTIEDDSHTVVDESSLKRLSCALGGKTMLDCSLTTIQTMLQTPDWRYLHAGLLAIAAISKECHKEMTMLLDDLVHRILGFLNDSHPRVRYAACNALGQMSIDFPETFQKKFHSKVIPGLLSILDDHKNPRIQAHAGASLVKFAKGCPSRLLLEHLPEIIEKLEQVLSRKCQELVHNNHKLVVEQIVVTLAAIAGTVAQEFSPYYDRIMPQLTYLFKNAITPDYQRLRGKTIECISLIGLSVGKEKFINDCYEIMPELVQTKVDLGNGDSQMSYLFGAWTRICQILGKDFEQYLPIVMRSALKAAAFVPEVTVLAVSGINVAEDENWEAHNIDDQAYGISTTGLEEKASACSMLVCCAKELKEGFVNYVEDTTKLMVPLVRFYLHKGVRVAAVESLPHLLDCAKLRGNEYVRQMWEYMNKELFKAMEIEPDYEVLGELFSSLRKCVETLGVSSLTANELKELTTLLHHHLKKHFQRSNECAEKRRDEDYDEKTEEMLKEDEFDAFILNRLSDIIHSLVVTLADSYLIYFDTLVQHYHALLQDTRSVSDRQCALCVFNDVIQFTGAHSHRYSQLFLPRMAESLADSVPEIRQAAAYGFGVIGMNGGSVYARACAEALPRLLALIDAPDSRLPENNTATENAISAVTKILKHNNSCADNLDKLHQIWLSCLPLNEDTDETPYVYGYLCDLIQSNNPIIIGQDGSNVPNLIKLFADAFAKPLIGINSIVGQRMVFILQHLQTANMSSPSDSSGLSSNIFVIEDSLCPRFDRSVIQKYQNNQLINQCLQCVPKLLLSERSLNVFKECDQADDSKNEIIQHVVERMQRIEITVDENKSKYCSTDGTSTKLSDGTYVLQINHELLEDCVNSFEKPLISNQAKLRLLVTICHEFVHHKMHKYLLNDKWGTNEDETTPPELYESGFYWENHVIGGRVIKTDRSVYSFLPKGQPKVTLDEDLCLFLLDTDNYDDANDNAYSRKDKQHQQQLQSTFSAKRPRRKIEHLYINLSGTQKIKKTKSDTYPRYRLTPNHSLFAEVTLINNGPGSIIYPDLPENCGGLRAYLYKYNEDDGDMFTVNLPRNENDWTCTSLRERSRATPFIIPDNVIIETNEAKTFKMKLMEIATSSEEENERTGHYYLEVVMGYYIEQIDAHYADKRTIQFDVEYDNGKNNDENIEQDETPILKQ